MKTDSTSYANRLPVPSCSEVGIIIGIRGKEHGYNPFIKGDNDGFLIPARTKLDIVKDVAIIKSEHSILTHKSIVCKFVVEFLQSGSFISKK